MKAQVIFASVFLAGVLSGARSASAQQDGRGTVPNSQVPNTVPYSRIPMIPAIQLPLLAGEDPLQAPGNPLVSGPIVYPPQPQLGWTCYAGNAIGLLVQALPSGSNCVFTAYGVQYAGSVGP
jgi:hypothetical protein